MRIIFIGIHNKQGFKPLDSKTPSGMAIDEVIEILNPVNFRCVKTNLFDSYEMPKCTSVRKQLTKLFLKSNDISGEDILVLLGKDVQKYLLPIIRERYNHIVYRHPSPIGNVSRRDYVNGLSKAISNHIANDYKAYGIWL